MCNDVFTDVTENLLNELQGGLKEQYSNFISQVKQEMQEKSLAIEAEVQKIQEQKEQVSKQVQEVEEKVKEVQKKEEEVRNISIVYLIYSMVINSRSASVVT